MADSQSTDYTERLQQHWTEQAPAWDRWADRRAGSAEDLNRALREAAGIAPGQTVLDLASGAGEPALSIAAAVAPDGQILATDLTEEMLESAKRRAKEAGIRNIEFQIADMESLPFEDSRFDAVTCRFGLMYCAHADRAAAEALRVLKPGGRAAFAVWGPIEDTTMFRVSRPLMAEFLGDMDLFDTLQFRFGGAGTLAAILEPAGFAEIEEIELRSAPRPRAGPDFIRSALDMRYGARLAALPAGSAAEIEAAVERAFEPYLKGEFYELTAHNRIGTGRKA